MKTWPSGCGRSQPQGGGSGGPDDSDQGGLVIKDILTKTDVVKGGIFFCTSEASKHLFTKRYRCC